MANNRSLPVSPRNNSKVPSKSPTVSRAQSPILLSHIDYNNVKDEQKYKYALKPTTPSTSPSKNNPPSSSPSNSPSSKNNPNPNNKLTPLVGGVNLTPLISALLLAGIKLALDQKKKAKASKAAKAAKGSKAAKATASGRRKTI